MSLVQWKTSSPAPSSTRPEPCRRFFIDESRLHPALWPGASASDYHASVWLSARRLSLLQQIAVAFSLNSDVSLPLTSRFFLALNIFVPVGWSPVICYASDIKYIQGFRELEEKSILLKIYKTCIRPLVKSNVFVFSPYKRKDIFAIEKVQINFITSFILEQVVLYILVYQEQNQLESNSMNFHHRNRVPPQRRYCQIMPASS